MSSSSSSASASAPSSQTHLLLLTSLQKLVHSLLSRTDCAPFASPVDWRGLELYDYTAIVQNPMDLGTIRKRLDDAVEFGCNNSDFASNTSTSLVQPQNSYPLTKDGVIRCLSDCRLVFNNCLKYNAEGSDFHAMGLAFSNRFESRLEKLKRPANANANANVGEKEEEEARQLAALDGGEKGRDRPMRVAEKTTFGRNLFKVRTEDLGYVVSVLEGKCPDCLIASSGGNIEINIDVIEPRVFADLDNYMAQKLGDIVGGGKVGGDDGGGRRKKRQKVNR